MNLFDYFYDNTTNLSPGERNSMKFGDFGRKNKTLCRLRRILNFFQFRPVAASRVLYFFLSLLTTLLQNNRILFVFQPNVCKQLIGILYCLQMTFVSTNVLYNSRRGVKIFSRETRIATKNKRRNLLKSHTHRVPRQLFTRKGN